MIVCPQCNERIAVDEAEAECLKRAWDWKLGGLGACGSKAIDGRIVYCDRHEQEKREEALELLEQDPYAGSTNPQAWGLRRKRILDGKP